MLLEVLEFIYKDAWHFIGTVVLLESIFGGIRGLISIVHNKYEVK